MKNRGIEEGERQQRRREASMKKRAIKEVKMHQRSKDTSKKRGIKEVKRHGRREALEK